MGHGGHQDLTVRHLVIASAVLIWLGGVSAAQRPRHPSLLRSDPAVSYATTPAVDRISRVNARLAAGELTLTADPDTGYLRAILQALDIDEDSQLMVFSKSSFQAPRISPDNPRAIYFNDDVAVGYVRGSDLLEFVDIDPKLGAVFYTLQQPSPKLSTPRFQRADAQCVSCHLSEVTNWVPGWFTASVFASANGTMEGTSSVEINHRTPFEFRWGGWFVVGSHQFDRHLGNTTLARDGSSSTMVTPQSVRVGSLEGRFDPSGYLAPMSDIVAMLVLDHQATLTSLLTRIGYEAGVSEKTRPLDDLAADIARYMLFADEEPLPGPVHGPTTFAQTFAARGPFDRQGRTLRQLDLQTRLFKYPCSYLIYSPQFDGLPEAAKTAIYAKLWAVLSGGDRSTPDASLTRSDRTAVVEILRETKAGLPDYFQASQVR